MKWKATTKPTEGLVIGGQVSSVFRRTGLKVFMEILKPFNLTHFSV
nr:MAG TPA: hypothetical protein [Caudoviricetes sp.]